MKNQRAKAVSDLQVLSNLKIKKIKQWELIDWSYCALSEGIDT